MLQPPGANEALQPGVPLLPPAIPGAGQVLAGQHVQPVVVALDDVPVAPKTHAEKMLKKMMRKVDALNLQKSAAYKTRSKNTKTMVSKKKKMMLKLKKQVAELERENERKELVLKNTQWRLKQWKTPVSNAAPPVAVTPAPAPAPFKSWIEFCSALVVLFVFFGVLSLFLVFFCGFLFIPGLGHKPSCHYLSHASVCCSPFCSNSLEYKLWLDLALHGICWIHCWNVMLVSISVKCWQVCMLSTDRQRGLFNRYVETGGIWPSTPGLGSFLPFRAWMCSHIDSFFVCIFVNIMESVAVNPPTVKWESELCRTRCGMRNSAEHIAVHFASRKEWVRTLCADGDIEKNPGPAPPDYPGWVIEYTGPLIEELDAFVTRVAQSVTTSSGVLGNGDRVEWAKHTARLEFWWARLEGRPSRSAGDECWVQTQRAPCGCLLDGRGCVCGISGVRRCFTEEGDERWFWSTGVPRTHEIVCKSLPWPGETVVSEEAGDADEATWVRNLVMDGDIEANPGPEVSLEQRCRQREKQIAFGKETLGYAVYTALVPNRHREEGNPHHPVTPSTSPTMARRQWTKRLVEWRCALHAWDGIPYKVQEWRDPGWMVLCQATQWVHDVTKDGDVERNPGPVMDMDVEVPIQGVNRVTSFTSLEPSLKPSWEEIASMEGSTLTHLPKGAIIVCAQAYTKLLGEFNDNPGWETLHALWAYPKTVWAPLSRTGKSHWAAVGRKITARSKAYMEDVANRPILWAQTRLPPQRERMITRMHANKVERIKDEAFVSAVTRAVGEGAISRATQMLISDGVMDSKDPEVFKQLQALHPSEPEVGMVQTDQLPKFEFDQDPESNVHRMRELRKRVFSFPPASAAGPSGLRADHLKAMIGEMPGGEGEMLLKELDRFVCTQLRDGSPEGMAQILCCARLTPLKKKAKMVGSQDGVRPVAAGETLRRLVGKTFMHQEKVREANRDFLGKQHGVGVPSACSLVGMSLQQLVNCLRKRGCDNWVVLLVDLKNAFNHISRMRLLTNILGKCPEAFPWLQTCLGKHTPLFVGGQVIMSQTGVPQGCPVSGWAFCLGINDILQEIDTMLEWQAWYMDDGLLVGDMGQLANAIDCVEVRMRERGMEINWGKCVLWGPGATNEAVMGLQGRAIAKIPRTPYGPGSGITVLGIPVTFPGDHTHAARVWGERLSKVKKILEVLEEFPEPHIQYTLLKLSLSACRVNDLMRACNLNAGAAECQQLTDAVRHCLEQIAGTLTPITVQQWSQATLPVRHGGLGIDDPVTLRPAARMAGIVTFLNRIGPLSLQPDEDLIPPDSGVVIHRLGSTLGNMAPLPAWQGNMGLMIQADPAFWEQRWWAERIHEATKTHLLNTMTGADSVRFQCQTRPHANAWLSVQPSIVKRTLIPKVEFACLTRWTLGMAINEEVQGQQLQCPRCKKANLDASGHHLVCCEKTYQRRHYAVVDSLASLANRAGLPFRKEQRTPENQRPGDLFISRYDVDGPGAVDVTIHDPLAMSNPTRPEKLAEWHAGWEEQKFRKYRVACASLRWTFVPFVMDVYGGVGAHAQDVITRLLKGLKAQREGWQHREVEAGVWQSLTFTLMREVARQLVWSAVATGDERLPPDMHYPYS